MFKYKTSIILQQLISHEGLVLTPYADSVGTSTIGIGRNLLSTGLSPFELEMIGFSPTIDLSHIKEITEHDARWLCCNDIFRCEKEILIFYPPILDLSEARQLVLIDMLFNLGLTKLKQFVNFFDALESKNHSKAADEMLDSKWAKQVGQRAITLSDMMRSG